MGTHVSPQTNQGALWHSVASFKPSQPPPHLSTQLHAPDMPQGFWFLGSQGAHYQMEGQKVGVCGLGWWWPSRGHSPWKPHPAELWHGCLPCPRGLCPAPAPGWLPGPLHLSLISPTSWPAGCPSASPQWLHITVLAFSSLGSWR